MRRIVLATGNQGKVREISEILAAMGRLDEFELFPYSALIEPFEIEESGATFKENALIKARAVAKRLPGEIVMSDDSGISVPALGGIPGIYSARFAGVGAKDADNLAKLSRAIDEAGLQETPAFYTACIALVGPKGEASAHGWMHGVAIAHPRGSGGFGYDPIFIPEGYNLTLGELDDEIKSRISHRARALELALKLLGMVS
ncbi:MAG: RdgB/HAM1 family non-canonical purine NTP pyrophosphatase [Campylobacterales bacterium]